MDLECEFESSRHVPLHTVQLNLMPSFTDRSERLNCFSYRKLLSPFLSLLLPCLGKHLYQGMGVSTFLNPSEHVLTRSMSGEPHCQLTFSCLLLCLLLTTLHPNRHHASMSGHKLLSSLAPNYYPSIAQSEQRLFSQCLMIMQIQLFQVSTKLSTGLCWEMFCHSERLHQFSKCIIVILHDREWQYYLY